MMRLVNRLVPSVVLMALPAAAWAAGRMAESACCCCPFCCP
jgi:hypothetical protein